MEVLKAWIWLLKPRISTAEGFATQMAIGKKSKQFDIGLNGRFFSKGYYTQNLSFSAKWQIGIYGFNTRLSSKTPGICLMEILAGGLPTGAVHAINKLLQCQHICSIHWSVSLNANHNNFGFPGARSGFFLGEKCGQRFKHQSHLFLEQFKMRNMLSTIIPGQVWCETILPNPPTKNNTQSVMLMYVPVFFNKTGRPILVRCGFKT